MTFLHLITRDKILRNIFAGGNREAISSIVVINKSSKCCLSLNSYVKGTWGTTTLYAHVPLKKNSPLLERLRFIFMIIFR